MPVNRNKTSWTPMMAGCAQLDALEAIAWDRLGGPTEEDTNAIRNVERDIGFHTAETTEVAHWRIARFARAIENEWDSGALGRFRAAVKRDVARFPELGELEAFQSVLRRPTRVAATPSPSLRRPDFASANLPRQELEAPPPASKKERRMQTIDDKPAPPKLAYSIEEAADATAISKSALYEDIRGGKLIVRKRGARTVIIADELRDYLNALPTMEAF